MDILVIVIGIFLVGGYVYWVTTPKKDDESGNKIQQKAATKTKAVQESDVTVKASYYRKLPDVIYLIAVFGFIAWILIALGQESWEAFGIGIGATIACFVSGRVIELLQNIDDELYRKRMSESP
tara:strand:- start:333 stop:704 length:372 start_codon:yes stop_codon:yes gene_type:complete